MEINKEEVEGEEREERERKATFGGGLGNFEFDGIFRIFGKGL